jgi:hypothetical protein
MRGSVDEVKHIHEHLTAGSFKPQEPREQQGRFTFSFKAPGGVAIEVNPLLPGTEQPLARRPP